MSEGYRLGEIAYNQQDWAEAAKQYGYYLGRDNTNIEILEKYAEANLNIRPRTPGNFTQALQSYRIIMRNDPDNAEAVKKASELYLASGSAGESELIIKDFLVEHSDSAELHPLLAASLAIQNKEPELTEAMERYPDYKTSYYQALYLQMIKADKYNQAAELLKAIISEYPDEVKAYDLLSRTINTKPEMFDEDAFNWVNKAVEVAPENPEVYLNRARYYISKKQNSLAIDDINSAIKIPDCSPDNKMIAASLYASAGIDKYDIAGGICAEIFSEDNENIGALQAMANYAALENDKLKLIEIVDMGLEKLSPTHRWDFIPSAIEYYTAAGENDKAEKLISEVEKTNTMPEYISFWKGLIAHNLENTNDEIMLFTKAIQLGYDNIKIKQMLASAYEKNNNTQSAIMQLKLILNQNPDNISIMIKLAELYLKIDNFNETNRLLTRALELSPNNSRAILLSLNTLVRSADQKRLKEDTQYYSELMDKLSSYKFGVSQPYQIKTIQFQLALSANQIGDAEAILKEIEITDISKEQIENLQIALLLTKGEKGKAMEILDKQISEQPDNLDLILRHVSLLVSTNQIEVSQSILDKALENHKSNLSLKRIRFAKADLYLLDREDTPAQPEKAIEQIKLLNKAIPNDISTIQRLLSFEQINTDFDNAKQYIDQIKKIEGQDGIIWKQELSRLRLRKDDIPESEINDSIALLKENIAANPGDTNSVIMLAMFYEKTDQIQLAASLWLEAYNNNTGNLDFALNACRCLQLVDKYTESDDLLSQILSRFPNDSRLINLEINRLIRSGQRQEAEQLLIELNNNGQISNQQLLTLANIKTALGDYEAAHIIYDQIIASGDYDFIVLAAKASVYAMAEEFETSLEVCQRAIDEFDLAAAYMLKARIHMDNDQLPEAIGLIDHALQMDNITATDYITASSLYINIENIEKAREIISSALESFPDNINIIRLAIQLLINDQQYKEQAEKLLEDSLVKYPDDVQLNFIKATQLYASGTKPDYDQALDLLNKIVIEDPENIQGWLMLGEIEFSRQQYQRTVDIVYQGLSFNPENTELMLLKARAESEFSPELAKTTLTTLQRLNSSDATIAIRLASIYASQDNTQEALSLLETADTLTDDEQQLQTITLLRALINHMQGNTDSKSIAIDILSEEPDNAQSIWYPGGNAGIRQ